MNGTIQTESISDMMKQKAFRIVQDDVREWLHDHGEHENTTGACALFAFFGVKHLRSQGFRALIQAGSCLWPRVNVEQDDGVMNTHFGYEWDSSCLKTWKPVFDENRIRMPEIHVWCALPDEGQIVDFSVHCFPEQCERRAGEKWIGSKPPDFFWGGHEECLAHRCRYTPDYVAIRWALSAIEFMTGEPT